MSLKPGQFYFLERPRLRRSTHGHPCLILKVKGDLVQYCFLSTQFELVDVGDLTLHNTDKGFAETGLKQSSFLVFSKIAELPIRELEFGRQLGVLSGDIKKQVEDWYGMPLQ